MYVLMPVPRSLSVDIHQFRREAVKMRRPGPSPPMLVSRRSP